MSKPTQPKILIAMPAYNEEKYVGSIVLKARQYADKVLVLDDGSTDDTSKIARLAGATVIRYEENRGKGAAIQSILAEAKRIDPDILVLLDADSQHNPDEIPRFIQPIVEGFDLVIGSRKLQKSRIPLYRRIGQKVLLHSTHILSGKGLTDSECGFRALSPKAVTELNLSQSGFAIETEMITVAAEKGLKITEVPISVIYTKDGSTLNPVKHGLGVFARILAMISEKRPLFFFGIAGMVFTIVGLILGANVLYVANAGGGVAVGSALVSVLFIVIGVFSVFTGLMLNEIAKRKERE